MKLYTNIYNIFYFFMMMINNLSNESVIRFFLTNIDIYNYRILVIYM